MSTGVFGVIWGFLEGCLGVLWGFFGGMMLVQRGIQKIYRGTARETEAVELESSERSVGARTDQSSHL